MSAPNSEYDPKQVSALDAEAVASALATALAEIEETADLDALKAVRLAHAGDRSPLALANREIGALPPAAKAEAGKRVGEARARIRAALDARALVLEEAAETRMLEEERVDVTMVVDDLPRGARHPLTSLSEYIGDVFLSMGWEVAEGPELEAEWFNFDALNIPAEHPARGMHDTFFVAPEGSHLVLRTHTSPVQARTMLAQEPPIYVVVPGRVFRTDELDATHSPVFSQVEGLAIDEGLTMAHLRGTLLHFAQAMFGAEARVRWRPSYFPFTEPSAEFDLWHPQAKGGPRWIEWGGCGMVNPAVLRASGIDADRYTGFAFGMGLERTLMFRHGITDLRDMFEGDIRFSQQFGVEI